MNHRKLVDYKVLWIVVMLPAQIEGKGMVLFLRICYSLMAFLVFIHMKTAEGSTIFKMF
jgi:hypothetical protein